MNQTDVVIIMKRVFQLISGMGLSINGKHTYCGDYIYSGHTIILVMSYLIINECESNGERAVDAVICYLKAIKSQNPSTNNFLVSFSSKIPLYSMDRSHAKGLLCTPVKIIPTLNPSGILAGS